MARRDFHPSVGDVVRFRQWDDMVAEFGIDNLGNIPCDQYFTKYMKNLCGKSFVIQSVRDSGTIQGHFSGYKVSYDMVEYIPPDEPLEFDVDDAMNDFLDDITVKG